MIEAPGIFDPDNNAADIKESLISCIVDCAPGVHAFILVMKVARYTDEEKKLVSMFSTCFGEETLKYTAVLYTHGQRLEEGQTIKVFTEANDDLKKCFKVCGGGVHVIDSKSWNEDGRNSTNLKNLLNSIGDIIKSNDGGYHTTQTLDVIKEKVEKIIKEKYPRETDAEARATLEMIKIVTPVLKDIPTLLLLSILLGIRKGLKEGTVEQVILKAIEGAVEGGVATINIVKDSSDLYQVSDELKEKIKETDNQCVLQ